MNMNASSRSDTTQQRDPGVIGMEYFVDRDSHAPYNSNTKINSNSNSNSNNNKSKYQNNQNKNEKDGDDGGNVLEYSKSGSWGSLTPEERRKKNEKLLELEQESKKMSEWHGIARSPTATMLLGFAFFTWLRRKFDLFRDLPLPSIKNAALALGALVGWGLYRFKAPKQLNRNPPGVPKRLPYFGQTLEVLPEQFKGTARYMLRLNRSIGFKTWELNALGGNRAVVLMDPIDRRHVLRDNWKNYLKNVEGYSGLAEYFAEILLRGIFATDKAEWQDHRKIASQMFSVNGLRNQMEKVFQEHSLKLVEHLQTVADTGQVIDLQEVFQNFTFDTICDIAFGVSPEALEEGFRTGNKPPFLVAFDRLQIICSFRIAEPDFSWKLRKAFGIGNEGEAVQQQKILDEYIQSIIDARRRISNEQLDAKEDLLSMYLSHARKTGQEYMERDHYLKGVILNMMVAGRDTTSCTLTNVVNNISQAANGEQLIQSMLSELREKVGAGAGAGAGDGLDELNWESTKNLPTADAVFNETLRMTPPVAGDFRITEHDDVLPSSGFVVQKGTRVVISNLGIGRDPSLWKDPNEFNPQRWIQHDDESGKALPVRRPDEYVFPVFWGGPRLCLGKDMARFEVKMVMFHIFSKFRFEVIPPKEVNYVNGPVIFFTEGLRVRITNCS